MSDVGQWLLENKEELAVFLLALIAVSEAFVRLTPTKTDDGAVERVGAWIKKLLDMAGLPNNKKKSED